MTRSTDFVAERARTRDGRELHLERAGSGSPTVVFESGMGASRSTWGAVAPTVAEHTAAVVYDRSGLGRSPADSAPRGLARQVDDLLDLLDHLGDRPFVLVGHSWGGPIVRSVADRAPDRIAGLVLVDQTDEGCDLFFAKTAARRVRFVQLVGPMAARLGLLRRGVERLAERLPDEAARAMVDEDTTVASIRTFTAELVGSTEDLRDLRAHPHRLPDVPVTLISGLRPARTERGRRPELVAAHRARADALPQGRHVGAEQSGHHVPFTEPRLVIDEILRVVAASG